MKSQDFSTDSLPSPYQLETTLKNKMSPQNALVKMYFFLIDSQITTPYTLAAFQDAVAPDL